MDCRIYRQTLKVKSTGKVEKLAGEEVPTGFILEVTKMALTNITRGDTRMELGYIDAGGEDRVICMNLGTNIRHHHLTGLVFLMAGEQPYGRVTTASDDDLIYFICHGKLWPVE